MDFLTLSLEMRERNTYDRICSELYSITEALYSGEIELNKVDEILKKFKSAMDAKDRIVERIAKNHCLNVKQIITIFDGKMLYNPTASEKNENTKKEIIARNKESFENGASGLDSVERSLVDG